MFAARRLAAVALMLGACSQQPTAEPANNAAAPSEIEALPPDESASTPTDELANGAAEPQGNTADVEP